MMNPSENHIVSLKLPSLRYVLESWERQEHLNLETLVTLTGQSDTRLFDMAFLASQFQQLYWLNIALQTYLGKPNYI